MRVNNLAGLTFHDMRHTAASLWVAAGASDLEVAKWAGHRSAAFAKSRYAHLFPEHGQALADRLDAFIAPQHPRRRPRWSHFAHSDVHQMCTRLKRRSACEAHYRL